MQPVNQAISAGLGGFAALFLLACALWLLMRSMLRHLRSADHHLFESDAGGPGASGSAQAGISPKSSRVQTRPTRPGQAPS